MSVIFMHSHALAKMTHYFFQYIDKTLSFTACQHCYHHIIIQQPSIKNLIDISNRREKEEKQQVYQRDTQLN